MSIAGYLSAGNGELRMQRDCWDELGGAVVGGPVMEGKKSVEEALTRDAVGAVKTAEDVYRSLRDYDAVLRSHCRIL